MAGARQVFPPLFIPVDAVVPLFSRALQICAIALDLLVDSITSVYHPYFTSIFKGAMYRRFDRYMTHRWSTWLLNEAPTEAARPDHVISTVQSLFERLITAYRLQLQGELISQYFMVRRECGTMLPWGC